MIDIGPLRHLELRLGKDVGLENTQEEVGKDNKVSCTKEGYPLRNLPYLWMGVSQW